MPCVYSINFKEEKVAMKITGYKTLCVTIMLCITTNGNELPQYVILSRETVQKEFFFAKIISPGMTSKLMQDWLGCA
jgi:uncharacterized Zn finger protein